MSKSGDRCPIWFGRFSDHDWSDWFYMNPGTSTRRHRQCNRCLRFEQTLTPTVDGADVLPEDRAW